MGITGAAQLSGLFYACGTGFWVGLYYELFRTLRLVFPPTAVSCFFQDVFFCMTAAVAVFFSLLATTDGVLYLYSLAGISAGFCVCYCTVGRVLHLLLAALLLRLFRAFAALRRWLFRLTAPLRRLLALFSAIISKKICREKEKSILFLKNHLKKPPRI